LRFWDSSAIVPLLSNQPASGTITRLLREDTEIAVWWGAWVESAVAVSRLKREGRLNDDGEDEARATLDQLAEAWSEVRPTEEVRLLASLISREHPLKAGEQGDERDLVIAATNSWCVAFDNISTLQPWLSDAMCRLSTGGGFSARELYTDSDEVLFDATRPLILNGIADVAT
jgi:hypothetical protein